MALQHHQRQRRPWERCLCLIALFCIIENVIFLSFLDTRTLILNQVSSTNGPPTRLVVQDISESLSSFRQESKDGSSDNTVGSIEETEDYDDDDSTTSQESKSQDSDESDKYDDGSKETADSVSQDDESDDNENDYESSQDIESENVVDDDSASQDTDESNDHDETKDTSDSNDTEDVTTSHEGTVKENPGKQEILNILAEQGVVNLTQKTIDRLPKWSTVTYLYGNGPRILGLDTCEAYRKRVPTSERLVSVAGTFNSGTNLLAFLLMNNCLIDEVKQKYPRETGIKWQVPWGKHNPPFDEEYRLNHKEKAHQMDNATNILSAVTIRDPYTWMASMCRNSYNARWPHSPKHCPNLLPNDVDRKLFPKIKSHKTVPVSVNHNTHWSNYTSLAHMWNGFNVIYFEAEFERIMVRLEDLVFYPKQVTEQICSCAGGHLINSTNFKYHADAVKFNHPGSAAKTTLISAMIEYGTGASRFHGYDKADIRYAHKKLDRKMMEYFRYRDPSKEHLK